MKGSPDKKGAFRRCTCPRGVRSFMREQHVTPGTRRSDYIGKQAQFHRRILRTWVHGLATGIQNHNTDEKRVVADLNDDPMIVVLSFDRVGVVCPFAQVVSCQN